MVVEWKNEWNSARKLHPMESNREVKMFFIKLYKMGFGLNALSRLTKNRISASGIRSMLLRHNVELRERGGKHAGVEKL